MDLFRFTKGNADDPAIELRDRCGVLIKVSEFGYLWIAAPFWDDSDTVFIDIPRDREIVATIVINTKQEGSLPLTSFFAGNKDLPEDQVYVLSTENPHDWHPSYSNPEEVNALMKVKPMPEKLLVYNVEVDYMPGTDFVTVSWYDEATHTRMYAFVGLNLFYTSPEEEFPRKKNLYFIGNFDQDKLGKTNDLIHRDMVYHMENCHIYLVQDWINANNRAVMDILTISGFRVHVYGESKDDHS